MKEQERIKKLKDEIDRLKQDSLRDRIAAVDLQKRIVEITTSPSYKPVKAYRELKSKYDIIVNELDEAQKQRRAAEQVMAEMKDDLLRLEKKRDSCRFCPRCGRNIFGIKTEYEGDDE